MGSKAEQQCSHKWKGSSIVIYARLKLHFALSKMMELGEGFKSIRYNISKCFSVRKMNNETAAFVWLFNFIILKLLSVLKTFVSSWNRISVWMMPAPLGIYSIALVFCSVFLLFNYGAFGLVCHALGLLVIPRQTVWTLCENGFARDADVVFRAVSRMWKELLFDFWAFCEFKWNAKDYFAPILCTFD